MADKILIADDDPETLRLISLMLQRQGYQIVSATNGSQALALARSEHPDLIVLDVMMPDMDGFTVARQLRGQETTAGIPILMFTAKSQPRVRKKRSRESLDLFFTMVFVGMWMVEARRSPRSDMAKAAQKRVAKLWVSL